MLGFILIDWHSVAVCSFVLMTKLDARKIPALEWLACKLEDMVHSLGLCPNWSCCSYPTDVHQRHANTTYRAAGARHPLLIQSHLQRMGTQSTSSDHRTLRVIDRSDFKEVIPQPIPAEDDPAVLHSEWVWLIWWTALNNTQGSSFIFIYCLK